MKIAKAIEQLLAEESITDISEFAARVRAISKTRKKEEKLWEDIEEYLLENAMTDVAIDLERDQLVYRDQLFKEVSFRVKPSDQEYAAKKLYLGHRMIPYVHPDISQDEFQFQDSAGKTIPLVSETISTDEGFIYVSLMPPYGLESEVINIEKSQMTLAALDLRDWMAENNFKKDDLITITPINYFENIFQIEATSRKELAEQQLLIQRRDNLLTEAIDNALTELEEVVPADVTLFWAFALGDSKLLELPGTPIGSFINNHEELQMFFDAGFAHIQFKDYYDGLFEDAMEGMMSISPEDMGKAKDLDGIFMEMGSSFSSDFVAGKFILQLHERQELDTDEVMGILFRPEIEPFYNKKQEKNFAKAFEALSDKMAEAWATKRLSLPLVSLLKKTIQFKIEFIALLREIDNQMLSPEDFDFSVLMQLQPVDMMLDQLLSMIVNKSEEVSNKEVKAIAEQIVKAHEYFVEARDEILGNI